MTERLAALLRYSLDATLQNTVRLEQELKMATDYLEIERTRFDLDALNPGSMSEID